MASGEQRLSQRRATRAGPHRGLLALSWAASVNGRAPLFALGPVLPLVVDDLGLSFTVAGLLPSLPLVLMGLLAIPGGFLSDRFGHRRLIAASLLAIALGGGGRALASSAVVLLLTTVALGAAIGLMQPSLAAVARDAWPHRVGVATAVYSNGFIVGSYASVALGPTLLAVSGPLSWRGVLLVWAAFASAVALVALLSSRGDHANPDARFGGVGDLLDLYWIRGVLPLTIVLGAQSAIYYALGSWLPSYLEANGWTLASATGPTALLSAASIPAGLIAPSLADLLGRRRVLIAAGLLTVVAQAGLLVSLDWTTWLWAFLSGTGTTAAFTVSLTGPAVLAPPGRVGATAGAMLALAYAGSMVGPFFIGALRDLTGGYTAGYVALLLIAVVLTVASAAVPSHHASD